MTGPRALQWTAAGLIALILSGERTPLFIWNATASAPIGLYLSTPAVTITRGDLVLTMPPPSVAQFAARRGYLPFGVPLVKRIAALQGAVVCNVHDQVSIDGRVAGRDLVRDGSGRPLAHWQGCRTLQTGDVFLMMTAVPDSFDGRYFGPVRRRAILGKLTPLWTR